MLPAPNRLRKNRDFRLTYAKGRSHVHPLAVLYVLKRRLPDVRLVLLEPKPPLKPRVGFVVSKKQGKAVSRNRIRRRLREAVRLSGLQKAVFPVDLIFVGRSGLKTASWKEVQAAVEELLRRGGIETGGKRKKGANDADPP